MIFGNIPLFCYPDESFEMILFHRQESAEAFCHHYKIKYKFTCLLPTRLLQSISEQSTGLQIRRQNSLLYLQPLLLGFFLSSTVCVHLWEVTRCLRLTLEWFQEKLYVVGKCLTAVYGVTVPSATIALLLSLCVSRLKNLKYLTMLSVLLQWVQA